MDVLVGLDAGTTATKAVTAGADARVRDTASVGYPLLVPQPGWAELDAMEDLADRHEDFLDEIADAVREIQAHWRAHRASAAAASTRVEQPGMASPAMPKVGRNDPCPCGSGKKYKQCHGRLS